MSTNEGHAAFLARLFRCETLDSADREIRASKVDDPGLARLVWRAHRAAAEEHESLLERRARDLEALQAFGRGLAEARSLREVFDRAAGALQSLTGADAVAIASALPGAEGVEIHAARSLTSEAAERFREAIALGFVPLDPVPGPVRRLPAFDGYQGARAAISETDVLVVPVERRGREIVRLGLVTRGGPDERCVRVVFGASNHLVVHVDRVLAVAEAEQGRFRAILDSMPHAVVLTDASFQLVQANAAAERLLPRIASDPGAALRSVGDLDLVGLAYDVMTGRRPEANGDAMLPDGACLEIAVAPWRGATERPDGLVIVMLDVTTARRLKDQVAQSEKLSSLGRMIAGVAHELNNPLTSVIGYAQLLRTMPQGDKAAERLETIRREADRCRRIVHNLLRFARPHTPQRRPFSLNEAAENAAQLLDHAVRTRGCRLVVGLDRGIPAVLGDAHDIEQAIVNLVTNAQQAMVGADARGAITITTSRSPEGRVALEVDDDGPGIPEELRPKLFDPFFTTKAPGQGTGLGLWLVYNAVASHGGTIRAATSPSGGARFRMEFPAGGAVPERIAPPSTDASAGEPRISASILVVDPEAALAELICEALGSEGHRTVAAHDAAEALERLEGEPFDLVVSDATLPGLPGDRLAREVERRRPRRPGRILLTSGDWVSREPEAVARRLDVELLRKPFELDELRRIVRTSLRRGAGD